MAAPLLNRDNNPPPMDHAPPASDQPDSEILAPPNKALQALVKERADMETVCSLVGVTYPYDIEMNMQWIDAPWQLWNELDLAHHPRKAEFAEELLHLCRQPLKDLEDKLEVKLKGEYLAPPPAFLPGLKNRDFIWRLASKAAKKKFLVRCFKDAADAKADVVLKQVEKKWRAKCIKIIEKAYTFYVKERLAAEQISKRKADSIVNFETNKRARRVLFQD